MLRTSVLQAPVITLLSPSLCASKKAAGLLSSVLTSPATTSVVHPDTGGDELDRAFTSCVPGLSRTWNSVGVECSLSGAVVHFCSVDTANSVHGNGDDKMKNQPFALLSITESGPYSASETAKTTKWSVHASIQHSRKLLADQLHQVMSSAASRVRLGFKSLVGGTLTPLDVLRHSVSSDGLPLLSLERSSNSLLEKSMPSNTFLKEVVVPYFDYAEYKDGSTILSRFSNTEFQRPAVGVYQWPGSLTCIRPLPTAAEDQRLPPPSLIFHCNSHQQELTMIVGESGMKHARIGYSGGMDDGQIILLHEDLMGLDIRLCSRQKVSSAFSEAQESLLAGSIGELQNANVLLAGGEQAVDDHRTGKGDCWVEVRANVKQPAGYLRWKKGSANKQKIASIPDLPYE